MTEDGKKVEIADSPRYKMAGNGVTSVVVEWIGRRIIALDQNTKPSPVSLRAYEVDRARLSESLPDDLPSRARFIAAGSDTLGKVLARVLTNTVDRVKGIGAAGADKVQEYFGVGTGWE